MRESSAVGVFRVIPSYPMHAACRQQENIYAECFIITVCFIESVINIAYMKKQGCFCEYYVLLYADE